MKLFCKGTIVGMIAGATIISVAIVKDKNFYNMLKEKVDIAGNKLNKVVKKVKQKIEDSKQQKDFEKNQVQTNMSDKQQDCEGFTQSCNCSC